MSRRRLTFSDFYLIIILVAFGCYTPCLAIVNDLDIEEARLGSSVSNFWFDFILRQENHEILPHPFDVRKYTLDVDPNMDTGWLDAAVTIDCLSGEDNLAQVQFNFVSDWNITRVAVGGSDTTWDHDGEVLTVDLPQPKRSGRPFSVEVEYEGFPVEIQFMSHTFSPFWIESEWVATYCEPFFARFWYPCFDEPSDKAEDGCETIIRVPEGFVAASNGLLISERREGSRQVFHWRHSYPIATYLISVTIGRYIVDEYEVDGLPIQNFLLPSSADAAIYDMGRTPEMMRYFSNLFGDYPFEKYGVAFVQHESRSFGAMEHQTMTTVAEAAVTGDRRYEIMYAHELAHHWWGNAVTLNDFREIWLNEGFATYCEALWAERGGGAALRDQAVRSFRERYLQEDQMNRYSIYRDDYTRLFTYTTYQKAALVLHMLRWELGDDDFFAGLRRYYRDNCYGTVTTADFIEAVESVSGRELDDFFQGWIYGTGYPEYEISSYYTSVKGKLKAVVTVHQVQDDPTVFAMTLPIDPDGSGPLPTRRRWVSGRWFQFEVRAPDSAGVAEIVPTDWLLMTVAGEGDYPEPRIKKVRARSLVAGSTNSVTIVGENFTPVTRVELSSRDIEIESLTVNNNGNRIKLEIAVPEGMRPRRVSVTVVNPDGDKAKKKKALRVVRK